MTIFCTSSVVCTKATASGGDPGFQVWSLPCCSRTACAVVSRSPSASLISAIACAVLFRLSTAVSAICPRPFRSAIARDINRNRKNCDGLRQPPHELHTQGGGPVDRLQRPFQHGLLQCHFRSRRR